MNHSTFRKVNPLRVLSGIAASWLCFNPSFTASAQNSAPPQTGHYASFASAGIYPEQNRLYAVNPPALYVHPDFGKLLPGDNPEWYEQYDKRTLTTRSFVAKDGRVITQFASFPLHYKDIAGNYRAINPRLYPSADGWSAIHQPYPTYLNRDGSTELTISSSGERMRFNVNSMVAGKDIALHKYTAGDDGIFISNVIPSVDKLITFREREIKTDYILNERLADLKEDLVISEEVVLPSGYQLKENPLGDLFERGINVSEYIVVNAQGETVAVFKVPVIYESRAGKEEAHEATLMPASTLPVHKDMHDYVTFGKYNLRSEGGRYFIEVIVSAAWLNAPGRQYPVTVDPLVTGPTSNWGGGNIASCVCPTYNTAAPLTITVPANITVTNFYVSTNYYAPILGCSYMSDGRMYLTTNCSRSPKNPTFVWTCNMANAGTCYMTNQDLLGDFGCCMATPSCTQQTFDLNYNLCRIICGTGCNTTYLYYNNGATAAYRYSAYVAGRTVESTGWSLSASTLCSDVCNVTLTATGNYGVPPYTITHPWAAAPVVTGTHTDSTCTSIGTASLVLTIPNCPATCNVTNPLSVPAPVITDFCGNTVSGLTAKSLTINPVPVVTATPTSLNICAGDAASIVLSSCVPGSGITWTGDNSSSGSGNISNTPVNGGSTPVTVNYTAQVTANGCAGAPVVVPVTVNPLPVANVSPASSSICGGQGATLTATGGVSYTWSPASGLSSTTTDIVTATPSAATTYTVIVTDANGCTATATATINFNGSISPSITGNTTFCSGVTSVLDAGAGYTSYSWSTGATTQTVNAATGGTYTVLVTDANGCSGTATAMVTVHANPSPTITGALAFCNGNSTILDAGAGYISYLWNTAETTQTIVASAAGAYEVSVTDANGCQGKDSAQVSANALPAVSISPDAEVCLGGSTGLTSSGGLTYVWSPATGLDNPNVSNPTATPAATTTYTLTVTDGNGCSDTASVTVTVYPYPIANAGPAVSICNGNTHTLSASGGATYVWAPAASLSNANIANPIASPVTTTTYTVTVSVGPGCSATDTVTVSVLPGPEIEITPNSDLCIGASTQLVSLAGGATNFTWSPSTGLNNPNIPTPIASPTVTTTYTVTVMAANGCTSTATVTITVHQLPVINMADTIRTGLSSYILDPGSGFAYYSWSNGQTTQTITVNYPPATGNYCVTVTDANNCTATKCTFLEFTIGVKNIAGNTRFVLYPNPFIGQLNLLSENNWRGTLRLTMTDVIGREVYMKELKIDRASYKTSFDLSHLPAGVYLITLQGDSFRTVQKFIRQ